MADAEPIDVLVVGAGGAGCMAALRARHHGLRVLIVEKTHQFGGTTATSGGLLWIPNNGLCNNGDSREKSLAYLEKIVSPSVRRDRLEAYVDSGRPMIEFMLQSGFRLFADSEYPDYFSELDEALCGRSVGALPFDGEQLGDDFLFLRDQFDRFKLFGRVAFDLQEMYVLGVKRPGWVGTFLKGLLRYWLDLGLRRKTRRDRKLTMGNALMGQMWQALRAPPRADIWLNTELTDLISEQGRVVGARFSRMGKPVEVRARHGVILASGGFEANQDLRNRYWKVRTDATWSLAPRDQNTGQGLQAALKLGAATEYLDEGWWITTMRMPSSVANLDQTHITVFDVARPHGVCVNRDGRRFGNESGAYDRFGQAQIADHQKTGGTIPFWLVFDSQYRSKFTAGGIDPTPLQPDRKIPSHWWNQYIFRADTLAELATKIEVDPAGLQETARKMNHYARTGVDEEFGRGKWTYDRMWGDPRVKPNPCLGSIDRAPYYAIPLYLGDIGTKGGLKADAHARVLDEAGAPIPGLYAAGNASGSVFGYCYPGAGGTIGPALVFGFRAADAIAGAVGKSTEDPRPTGAPQALKAAATASVSK